MKKVKKPVFFLVFAVIAIFAITTLIGVSTQNGDITTTYVHGVKDIRLGIEIQFGARTVAVEVLQVAENVRKDDAVGMYREITP